MYRTLQVHGRGLGSVALHLGAAFQSETHRLLQSGAQRPDSYVPKSKRAVVAW